MYEYQVLSTRTPSGAADGASLTRFLDDKGEEGWRLISVVYSDLQASVILFLERQKK